MSILFRGLRLADESRDLAGGWLLVGEDGRIAELGAGDPPAGLRARLVLDGEGRSLALLPAFVELHAHFRDPGRLDKERLESGCLAAAAGGYATAVCMANTEPALSDPETALGLRRRAAALGLLDLYPALSMTRDLAGKDAGHLAALAALRAGPEGAAAREGLRLLSDDGRDPAEEGAFREALSRAAELELLASCHCELPGAPDSRRAEEEGVARAIRLGRETGCRLHLAHLSTRGSVDLARRAKAEATSAKPGFSLSCEATPHHLALTEAEAARLGPGSRGKVAPPLRPEEDRLAVVEGLLDGSIDAIATDHAPHSAQDKEGGAPGFSGLETAFGLVWTVLGSRLGLSALSRLMSAAPARLLGLPDRGRLEPGLRADLVLLDLGEEWTVDPARFKSRGANSPLAGRRLRGRPVLTICHGRITHHAL